MSCKRIDVRGLTLEAPAAPGSGRAPRRVVDGFSLTLEAGRALALVGESGAGKSLASLAIMGLPPPGIRRIGGTVHINECDAGAMPEREKRLYRNSVVSMIVQNPMSAFDPVFTIGSHFHETLVSHASGHSGAGAAGRISAAQSRAAAVRVLAEVGFSEPAAPASVLGMYPFQMSGGMLQRVMIALALVTDPTFIIADEATTDLDPVLQKQILVLLRERCRERHLGLLAITHDLGVAAFLADDIAVMHRGKVIEHGSVRDVFAAPQAEYTKTLLAAYRELHEPREASEASEAEERDASA